MRRSDVEASRELAARYVQACDELLTMTDLDYHVPPGQPNRKPWTWTNSIAGKQTGAHRRLSLDLTRALAHMRRRS